MSNSPPTPKPRWSARMGSVMRRTSLVLAPSRPASIASNKDADNASLTDSTTRRGSITGSIKGSLLNPTPSSPPPPPPPLPVATSPSPIAESPLREAAAVVQETVGPSPLAQPATSSEEVPPTPPTQVEEVPPILPSQVEEVPPTLPPQVEEVPPTLPPQVEEVPPALPPQVEEVPPTLPPQVEEVPPTLSPQVEETQSPTGYIPPPVIDSTAGNPGAFTDVVDEIPQPDIAHDPYAVAPVEAATETHVETTTVEAPEPATEVLESKPQEVELELEPTVAEELVEEPTSFFDGPMAESVEDFELADHIDSPIELAKVVHENANVTLPEPENVQPEEAVEHSHAAEVIPTATVVDKDVNAALPEADLGRHEEHEREVHHDDDIIPVTAEPEAQEETQQQTEYIAMPIPVPAAAPNYDLPSYPINLGSEQEVWGGEHNYDREGLQHPYESAYSMIPSSENLKSDERSLAPSIRMPEADPFADPIAPRITVSQSDIRMPEPHTAEHHQGPAETHRDIQGPIVMPLPSFYEVANPIRHSHSTSSLSLRNGDTGKSGMLVETDETLPLLSRPGSPNKHKPASYLQTSAHPHSRNVVSVSPLVLSTSHSAPSNGNGNAQSWNPHPGAHPRLHTLGWLEYHLPDGAVYYVHPTSRATTEINLRSERMLTGVERFLADQSKDHSDAMEGLATGGEIWLRDVGTGKTGMVLEKWWVDHRLRTVVMAEDEDHEYGRKGSGKGKAKKGGVVHVEEDQLDTEFRYWSFMEAHPAHNSLPAKAKTEAMDVLTWAWTERLLPSHRAIPAPFTQEECQELMTLIRSFDSDHHDDHGIQTRIVSRVLLRVAHWRQTYFRPNKPLPANAGSSSSRLPTAPRKPFRRALVDFVVSCLFLGIPYIFYERTRLSSRIDEEGGLRNATPTLVIGACTCLVAAIVLSASVTFLSLPGLDAFSRTTSMVAILFAAFSMASTVVAIFRHKADLERAISHVGIEGMMVITRRTVILSLPLVFLVYAIIAFIVGLVLYSFRGVTVSDPSMTKKSFEDYTKWGVVSVVGALAGMVTTSALLFGQ